MKDLFLNLLLFVVFVFVFSACGGSDNLQRETANEEPPRNTAASPAVNAEAPSKASEYAPLASSIAQADMEFLDGTVVKIGDRKGKVLLLNLWGVWCGPCKAEMPHLIEMQTAYREKGLEIIGLNVGDQDNEPEEIGKINEFAAKMGLNYELARISEDTTIQFFKVTKFGGVPQSILVDREGYMRGVFVGGGSNVIRSMRETIDKVVNE